jgi:hypothetical protein
MAINKNVRNVAIVLGITALVVLIPGGGKGANVAIQAVSLGFLAAIAWVASVMYREHRGALYALGDARRATLYIAAGVATLTLTATSRLWNTPTGEIVWIALIGGSVYAVFSVVWSARKY